jgi:hypothetical protein
MEATARNQESSRNHGATVGLHVSEIRLSRLAAQPPPNIDLFFSYWSFLVIFLGGYHSFSRLPGEPNRCKAS